MTFVIKYTETAEEIAANVEAVRATGNEVLLDWGISPEEWVAEWRDLYVCDADAEWSLGGVEIHEAHQFDTAAAADNWITVHGLSEPGTWEILPA